MDEFIYIDKGVQLIDPTPPDTLMIEFADTPDSIVRQVMMTRHDDGTMSFGPEIEAYIRRLIREEMAQLTSDK